MFLSLDCIAFFEIEVFFTVKEDVYAALNFSCILESGLKGLH